MIQDDKVNNMAADNLNLKDKMSSSTSSNKLNFLLHLGCEQWTIVYLYFMLQIHLNEQ